jgi:hypothetical protein
MTSKDLFIQDKDLAAWWSNIANSGNFDRVIQALKGLALETCPNDEQRAGVLFAIDALLTISQPDAPAVAFSQPGLSHNLEPKDRTLKPKTTK